MKLYIDSADIAVLERLWDWKIFAGITTNPVILARDRATPAALAGRLGVRFEGEIFFQVSGAAAGQLAESGRELARLLPQRVIVKVPSTPAGFRAMALLEEEGIRTAATALFTAGQGIAAAAAGASVIIPFFDRLEKAGGDPPALLEDLVRLEDAAGKPRVLAASLKSPAQVLACLRAGLWGVTVAPALAEELAASPLTDDAVAKFDEAAGHEEE